MYPDRENVERLEDGAAQDQALLASRGHQEPRHLAAEEGTQEREDLQEAEDQD
jgi:hypothetical protein